MYNLLDEKWIPVLYLNGRFERIGLIQALREASNFRPAYTNPMDNFALLRFILALGYWCMDKTGVKLKNERETPPEWQTSWKGKPQSLTSSIQKDHSGKTPEQTDSVRYQILSTRSPRRRTSGISGMPQSSSTEYVRLVVSKAY